MVFGQVVGWQLLELSNAVHLERTDMILFQCNCRKNIGGGFPGDADDCYELLPLPCILLTLKAASFKSE